MVLFLHRLGWFVFLVLLQVLVLNHVHDGFYPSSVTAYADAS